MGIGKKRMVENILNAQTSMDEQALAVCVRYTSEIITHLLAYLLFGAVVMVIKSQKVNVPAKTVQWQVAGENI